MTATDVLDMDREEFIAVLADKTTAQDLLDNSGQIYGYLSTLFGQNVLDSVIREWAFQWASETLGIDYDVIYQKWLAGFTL